MKRHIGRRLLPLICGYIIGIICIIGVSSCEPETILLVSQTTLSVTDDGGTSSLSFTANKAWTASSDQSWCKVSPSSGDASEKNNVTISVSCDANTTYDSRSCTITVQCAELSKTISVTQETNLGLLISQSSYEITNAAQNVSIEVKANVQYDVTIDAACSNWVKLVSSKGLTTNTVTLAISENTDYDGREGKVTISQKGGTLSETVIIKQGQMNGLFVLTPEYELSNAAHQLSVEIKANIDFEVVSNNDWIKYVETKALKTSTVVLDISANEGYDSRTGTVSVRQKGGGLEGTITIKQDQNAGLFIDPKEISVNNQENVVEVEVKHNVDYDIIIPHDAKDWIKTIETKALQTRTISFLVASNEGYDSRKAPITFKQKGGALSATLMITQDQKDGIFIETTEYDVASNEQVITIPVKANVRYDVSIEDKSKDWIQYIQTKGLSSSEVVLQISENEGAAREGKIVVGNDKINIIVTIKQGKGGVAEIPDAVFKDYCIKNFDKNGDGEISYSEAALVREIRVDTDYIKTLSGIEAFVNLTYLSCVPQNYGWHWGTVPYGYGSIVLYYINTGIEYQLDALDLSKNTKLKELHCRGNSIQSLDLRANTSLQILDCMANPLTTLDISNCLDLERLECAGTNIPSLDISAYKYLRHLDCGYSLYNTIDISNNPLLQVLYCSGMRLTTLDLSKAIRLKELNCDRNNLTSLDLSHNSYLERVNCSENLLEVVELHNNPVLVDFQCVSNKLKTLDFSDCPLLDFIYCTKNQLTSINIDNNPLLGALWCAENKLTTLALSDKVYLRTLICDNNQIEELDVSHKPQLYDLYCTNNKLTKIDITDDTSLQRFWCYSNLLTTLDLSTNTSLTSVYCTNNPYLTDIWVNAGQTFEEFKYDDHIATVHFK